MDEVVERDLSWRADILPDFEQVDLGAPEQRGPVLVRPVHQASAPRAVVLHVHGYNDYFFQEHLAYAFMDAGCAFYALDLRRAGRSLAPDDIPHLMHDVAEPGDDIARAAEAIAALHPGVRLVVHAHSTGGLTAAIWAADRPSANLGALVLDSPLFGRREQGWREWAKAALPVLGTLWPLAEVSHRPSVYARHLHVEGGGRWEFDPELKRFEGVPARACWALAVRRAQQRIARGGVDIAVPVLVARSALTGPESSDNPRLDEQDIVVDVEAISRLAPRLGRRVTELVVPGGIHELSLSRREPREHYLSEVLAWIEGVIE